MPRNKARLPRRRLSMTPLIDVIFLLLLFFMLTSTFTRFAEIPLVQGGAGVGVPQETGNQQTIFLRLTEDGISLNGERETLETLVQAISEQIEGNAATALLSIGSDVPAQSFVEALARTQSVPGLTVTVLR